MLFSQGSLSIFWSNWLVGGTTRGAVLMLFGPLVSAAIRKIRSGRVEPFETGRGS